MPSTIPPPNLFADRLIDTLLTGLLDRAPASSLVCLNLLDHEDRMVPGPRNSVGRPGRPAGTACPIRSLLDWDVLLPELRGARCALMHAGDHRPAPMRNRPWWSDVSSVLACPAMSPSSGGTRCGDLIGAVVIVWNGGDDPPAGGRLIDLMAAGTRVGNQVAAVLALCREAIFPKAA
jgi:hypothetical protein